jgi:hypothetical protein
LHAPLSLFLTLLWTWLSFPFFSFFLGPSCVELFFCWTFLCQFFSMDMSIL